MSLFAQDVIDSMKCRGATAIYKAIVQSCDMLKPFASQHPDADLRVLILSDGQNNDQSVQAKAALQALFDIGAVCDAIIVGSHTRYFFVPSRAYSSVLTRMCLLCSLVVSLLPLQAIKLTKTFSGLSLPPRGDAFRSQVN